ncbi:MAG TPA: hypothetical protein VLS93_07925 [Anaeromyxobacteraceae bacterium]|nr:hypothetical protein [Anaeromyxobacteraceae bacterium]
MESPLDRRIRQEIARLCQEGRRQHERGETSEALATYLEAWELLPDPFRAGRAAAAVLSGLADVLAARGDLSAAATVLRAVERTIAPPGLDAGT